MALKQMALWYAGVCRECATELPPKTTAVFDTDAKNVLCLRCSEREQAEQAPLLPPPLPTGLVAAPAPVYDGRTERRRPDPGESSGWRAKLGRGADTDTDLGLDAAGARQLAAELEAGLSAPARVLHGRKVPNTRGTIDHLVVAPSGVWLVDTTTFHGRVECRDVGGWRAVDLRLFVNGADRTNLVENFNWQIPAVRATLDPMGFGQVPIHPTLLFTPWKKGRGEKPIDVRGALAMWTSKLIELANEPGPLTDGEIRVIATELATKLPAA